MIHIQHTYEVKNKIINILMKDTEYIYIIMINNVRSYIFHSSHSLPHPHILKRLKHKYLCKYKLKLHGISYLM